MDTQTIRRSRQRVWSVNSVSLNRAQTTALTEQTDGRDGDGDGDGAGGEGGWGGGGAEKVCRTTQQQPLQS